MNPVLMNGAVTHKFDDVFLSPEYIAGLLQKGDVVWYLVDETGHWVTYTVRDESMDDIIHELKEINKIATTFSISRTSGTKSGGGLV